MENINSIIATIDFVGLAVKVVGILFSIGYFVFAVIFLQRLIKLDRTYTAPPTQTLFAFSWLQIAIGALLLIYALFFL